MQIKNNCILAFNIEMMGDEKWETKTWHRPSCIPVTVILALIIFLVALPFLDDKIYHDHRVENLHFAQWAGCHNSCRCVYLFLNFIKKTVI